jgi:hypothetical protein
MRSLPIHPAALRLVPPGAPSAFRSDPRAPLAAFTLGRVLLRELARPREAAAAFAQARALAPRGPFVEDALAREVEAWLQARGCSCKTYVDDIAPLQPYIDSWNQVGCMLACTAIACINAQPGLCDTTASPSSNEGTCRDTAP